MTYRYKNGSELRQALVIGGIRTQLMPGDVFESDREIKAAFLEKVADSTPITVKPGKRFSSLLNLQQKVTSLETQRDQLSQTSSTEIDSLKDTITALKETISDLNESQEKLVDDTNRKLEMMKTAIMMVQEDFYNVEFDDQGKAVPKEETFPK